VCISDVSESVYVQMEERDTAHGWFAGSMVCGTVINRRVEQGKEV